MGSTDLPIAKCLEILGLTGKASLAEAKEAHRDLAAVWHPDRFTENPRLQEKATEKLKEINVAFETLKAYHEAHGSFTEAPAPAQEAVLPEEERAGETAADAPEEGTEEPRGKRLVSPVTAWAVLIAIALTVVAYFFLTHKRFDVRSLPTYTPPYQSQVAESGTDAPKKKTAGPAKPAEGKESPAKAGKQPAHRKYFTLGSTREEVLAVEGPPKERSETRWTYGSSYVDFTKGLVTGWLMTSLDPLKVRIVPSRPGDGESFTLGSLPDAVAQAQGTPTGINRKRWTYGFSWVEFEKGRVARWYSSGMDPLRVVMKPSEETDREVFSAGSTKDEVLAVQGTPTQLSENRWGYGFSYVEFERGRVVRWYNSEQNPLKIGTDE